jgi:hypothetical protein
LVEIHVQPQCKGCVNVEAVGTVALIPISDNPFISNVIIITFRHYGLLEIHSFEQAFSLLILDRVVNINIFF